MPPGEKAEEGRKAPCFRVCLPFKGTDGPERTKGAPKADSRRKPRKKDFFHTPSQSWRGDSKNQICVAEGGGLGGREQNRPKTLFVLGNAMTMKC